MTIEDLMVKAQSGQKVTDADIEAFQKAELEAKTQRFLAHLRNLDKSDCEPCGSMLCCCNPTFRRWSKEND